MSSVFNVEPLFYVGENYDTGSRPLSIVVSDLDNDGDQDLTEAN